MKNNNVNNKRVKTAPKLIRLNRAIALAGVASRRKAEDIILSGKVSVNERVVKELATLVDPCSDKIKIAGKPLSLAVSHYYILLNKPKGYVTTCSDQEGRRTVLDLLGKFKQRLFPVGRLDIQSEGALLITNDGAFANRVINPSLSLPKKYLVKVDGLISTDNINNLRQGVVIDHKYKTKPALVKFVSSTSKNSWIEITIIEGKNRQVRKMCEQVGHTVLKIRRMSIGTLKLGNLKPGEFRLLTWDEVKRMYVTK